MRPVADSHQPGADSHQQQATIPPADADDAGARLVAWLVERDATVLVDLARDVIRQRDEARRKCEDAMALALHAHTARLAAKATVRELRALCEEAADHITPTAYVHAAKLAARLRAAAVQPASEGRADG